MCLPGSSPLVKLGIVLEGRNAAAAAPAPGGGSGDGAPLGGSAPMSPPRDGQDLRISPAVAFPFPLAFVNVPSYTYSVPFNLPACQLFQPSHYFYGSSLSSCQFIRVGLSRAGWDGTRFSASCASSMPSFIQPLLLLHLQID